MVRLDFLVFFRACRVCRVCVTHGVDLGMLMLNMQFSHHANQHARCPLECPPNRSAGQASAIREAQSGSARGHEPSARGSHDQLGAWRLAVCALVVPRRTRGRRRDEHGGSPSVERRRASFGGCHPSLRCSVVAVAEGAFDATAQSCSDPCRRGRGCGRRHALPDPPCRRRQRACCLGMAAARGVSPQRLPVVEHAARPRCGHPGV